MATLDESEQPEGALPPPTEEIHLPDPSFLPALVAFGLTIAIVGVVFSWVIVVLGGLIFLISLMRWIRQTRREMAELPLSH
jgi:Flp pilus assembly protein TadB